MALTPGLGWTLLEKKDLTGLTNADFLNLTGFDAYIFTLHNVRPVTNGANLSWRVSQDNCATTDSAADYHFAQSSVTYAGAPGDAGGSAAQWSMSSGVSNQNTTGVSGYINMIGLSTSLTKILMGPYNLTWWTGATHQMIQGSIIKSTSPANANSVRFFWSSGNFQDGFIKAYGIV